MNENDNPMDDTNAGININHKDSEVSLQNYEKLGDCYFIELEYGKALDLYNKALELDPTNEELLYKIKLCNMRINK